MTTKDNKHYNIYMVMFLQWPNDCLMTSPELPEVPPVRVTRQFLLSSATQGRKGPQRRHLALSLVMNFAT